MKGIWLFTFEQVLAIAERGPAAPESMIETPEPAPKRDPMAEAWRVGFEQAVKGQLEPDGGWAAQDGDDETVPMYLEGFKAGLWVRESEAA